MATEDSNQNDELLKRYAKERREQGGDFALHEATRRMLQGEVARQFRAREPQSEPGGAKGRFIFWLGLWRGRLALGGAVAAAVVLGVWVFGPGSKREATMQLAKNDNLAVESRLSERENLSLADSPQLGAAVQPSAPAPTLARGLAFDADQKSVEQLAKLKESQVAVVTVSSSLTPVQDSPANTRTKDLNDLYAKAPAQPAERYYALAPPAAALLGLEIQTNASATFAFSDSSKAYYEATGAGGPPTSFGRADGSTPFVGRHASMSSTNTFAVPQNPSTGPATALGFQPQVAYSVNAVGLGTTLNEPASRPEVSNLITSPREVALRSPAEKLVTLSSEPAAATPALTLAPQVEAFGADRKLSVAVVEQKGRSGLAADSIAPTGGALFTEAKGERMVFFRQSAQGLQENLARAVRRAEPTRLQADPAADKSAAAPEVLSEFTVELDGDTIRVTDADQSVYEGAISNEVAVSELDASRENERERALDETVRAEKRALPKAAAPVSRASRNYSFRATGSNVTLKQMVIVNGRLSDADGLAGAANRLSGLAGAGAAPAPATAPTQLRSRVAPDGLARGATVIATNTAPTIEGTVRVGATNEQRFRAVRSPR